jgi:hypothetical protein
MSQSNLTTLKNVLVMLSMDGKISPDEQEYLDQLRIRLGIDEAEYRDAIDDVRENPSRLSVPKGPAGQAVLDQLIEAAHADGELAEREVSLLKKVATYLGLSPSQLEGRLPVNEETAEQIEQAIDELYAHFSQWDEATLAAKLDGLVRFGSAAALPMLRVLESYRTPDGCERNVELKEHIARRLGTLGDDRAIYYLAQQVCLGDIDEEITSQALQIACAEAIEQVLGEQFTQGQTGPEAIQAVQTWWQGPGEKAYSRLSL